MSLIVMAVAGAGAAAAHATRAATDPVENSELSQAPQKVSATFNEALQPQFAAMTVVGPGGNLWSTGDPKVDGAVVSVGVRPSRARISLYSASFRLCSRTTSGVTARSPANGCAGAARAVWVTGAAALS